MDQTTHSPAFSSGYLLWDNQAIFVKGHREGWSSPEPRDGARERDVTGASGGAGVLEDAQLG